MTPSKRVWLSKGRGYFSVAGPQGRFIIFLVLVLAGYTLLLRVFQKLSEMLQLPLFLPISLVTLFVFIAVVGTLYSHTILGPLTRIQRAINRMIDGEADICLRLREADDPLLKDLAASLSTLCEHTRINQAVIHDAAADLFNGVQSLIESVKGGAGAKDLAPLIETLRNKQDLLDKAVKSFR
ncbi:MAG: hypothetical protein A2X56_11670 [Nitrospirae bacterium GWC2_57_13]|jgi:signal transduction histidine kinase|nr:MAG: hypothetical protein A2X56_11670 [Nitrospirae bacterium GWC2_57_13]OGW44685.1 MAG: hypothetical protein A2X57_07085 [Nitrospirae bacterium GWD2_57_8]HAR46739.1 hypothetical protein [Nitrospiraceae bacterium]